MKLSLTLTIFFFTLSSFGQPKVINKDLIKPDTNLLYYAAENHLALVKVPELKKITVVSSNNSEISVDDTEVVVRPRVKFGFDTLRFFKGKSEICSKIYTIVLVGDPISQLAFTSDTILYKSTIIANPILRVTIPNNLYKIDSHVLGFSCWVYKKNGQVFQFDNDGGKLSPKLIASIQLLSPGDRLVFENIRVGFAPSYCARTMMESLNIRIR